MRTEEPVRVTTDDARVSDEGWFASPAKGSEKRDYSKLLAVDNKSYKFTRHFQSSGGSHAFLLRFLAPFARSLTPTHSFAHSHLYALGAFVSATL